MTATSDPQALLPRDVEQELARLVEAARAALGETLASVVLFGSAAEGRLRVTSDVNLIFVLERFDPAAFAPLREPLRTARAAINVAPMFLVAAELPEAAEAFAVKFSDIRGRHRVLHGQDPFAALEISREAQIRQLRQAILNQAVRLRERYVALSLREEQLVRALAETAGPLRGAAATLLALEGTPAPTPREALERLAAGDPAHTAALVATSRAREQGALEPGEAARAFLGVMALVNALRERASRIV